VFFSFILLLINKNAEPLSFKTLEKVLEAEKKFKQGKSIGFTQLASLKSMGRIPRSSGQYMTSPVVKKFFKISVT